jgi:dephospho-CoA kinase
MQAELNRRLIARITPEVDVAIDGLRHPLDCAALTNSFAGSFRLLFIDSPPRLRFERLNQKRKYADFASFDSADSHPVEQQIDPLRVNATLVIPNEGLLQELYAKVDEAIRSIRKEGQS